MLLILFIIPEIYSDECKMTNCEKCWPSSQSKCIQCKNNLFVNTQNFKEYSNEGGSKCIQACPTDTHGQLGIQFTTNTKQKVKSRVCLSDGTLLIYIYIYINNIYIYIYIGCSSIDPCSKLTQEDDVKDCSKSCSGRQEAKAAERKSWYVWVPCVLVGLLVIVYISYKVYEKCSSRGQEEGRGIIREGEYKYGGIRSPEVEP